MVAVMITYPVTASRTGRYWAVSIGDIGATQARHLREVESMAREYVALQLDVPENSFALDVHLELPDAVSKHVQLAKDWHAREVVARAEASREMRFAAQQ
jgi:hypothetical protein